MVGAQLGQAELNNTNLDGADLTDASRVFLLANKSGKACWYTADRG